MNVKKIPNAFSGGNSGTESMFTPLMVAASVTVACDGWVVLLVVEDDAVSRHC